MTPPRLARRLLHALLPTLDRGIVIADLDEEFRGAIAPSQLPLQSSRGCDEQRHEIWCRASRCFVKPHRAVGLAGEHAVKDQRMEMHVEIERRPEALNDDDGAPATAWRGGSGQLQEPKAVGGGRRGVFGVLMNLEP